METGKADEVTGEARVQVAGGLAHFPGLAKEHRISFDKLNVSDRRELARLADAANFFGCTLAPQPARPDARTYTVALSIGERSREICVAEPIGDPALAKLISALRRLTAGVA